MANGNEKSVNEILVSLFNTVLETESRAVITSEFADITENDMHIIEAIGVKKPVMASEVARKMGVTAGTITVNMNSLEKKGYIERKRSDEDKRVVNTSLTEKGRKAYFHHRDFHKHMIKAAIKDFSVEEMNVLLSCLNKLNTFFTEYEYPGKE